MARGVTRLFCRQDLFAICEVPLPNGRRADMMAIDAKGALTIVEIKVAKADLLGDSKWIDYLEYCDRFFWAVPPGLASICEGERFLPNEAGLIVADRYDAVFTRDALKSAARACAQEGRATAICTSRRPQAVCADRPQPRRRLLGRTISA